MLMSFFRWSRYTARPETFAAPAYDPDKGWATYAYLLSDQVRFWENWTRRLPRLTGTPEEQIKQLADEVGVRGGVEFWARPEASVAETVQDFEHWMNGGK